MLVLTRGRDEVIMIGDNIKIIVVDIRGDKVRLGIEAPRDVPVHRSEVADVIRREGCKLPSYGGTQDIVDDINKNLGKQPLPNRQQRLKGGLS